MCFRVFWQFILFFIFLLHRNRFFNFHFLIILWRPRKNWRAILHRSKPAIKILARYFKLHDKFDGKNGGNGQSSINSQSFILFFCSEWEIKFSGGFIPSDFPQGSWLSQRKYLSAGFVRKKSKEAFLSLKVWSKNETEIFVSERLILALN